MNTYSIQMFLSLFLIILYQFSSVIHAQKQPISTHKGTQEFLEDGNGQLAITGGYSSTEKDVLNKIETQLFSALELLQAYQEAAPIPMKFAEKRRNKFEFIRFGRRRR